MEFGIQFFPDVGPDEQPAEGGQVRPKVAIMSADEHAPGLHNEITGKEDLTRRIGGLSREAEGHVVGGMTGGLDDGRWTDSRSRTKHVVRSDARGPFEPVDMTRSRPDR